MEWLPIVMKLLPIVIQVVGAIVKAILENYPKDDQARILSDFKTVLLKVKTTGDFGEIEKFKQTHGLY